MDNQPINTSSRIVNNYRNAKQIRPMTARQTAYVAGFMDARASITCNVIHKKRPSLLWRIRISGIDKPQIKYIYSLLGIGNLTSSDINGKRRIILTIGITEGTRLAQLVMPYMCIKWQQMAMIAIYSGAVIDGRIDDPVAIATAVSEANQAGTGRTINTTDPEIIMGYISGLWDGNGTVCVVNNRPIISIYNSYIEPLQMIESHLGGQLIKLKKKMAKNSQVYALRWSSWLMVDLFYNLLLNSNSKKVKKLYGMWIIHRTLRTQGTKHAT